MSPRCLLAVGSLCFSMILFSNSCGVAADLGRSLPETLAKGVAPGTTVWMDDAAGPLIAEVSVANLRGEAGKPVVLRADGQGWPDSICLPVVRADDTVHRDRTPKEGTTDSTPTAWWFLRAGRCSKP